MIAKVQSPQVAGNENIDGVATIKVTGTIDPAVVDPLVPPDRQGRQGPLANHSLHRRREGAGRAW
ncbi:LppX_LprAFG lipoprotein [Mycobacterium vicinigordonae]|uniref:LppX_LprAFG lipoprotein n=1 Tax=Mycobacterium vicinigordonae TaxID=1719132 RepID=UPI002483D116|nr:LppX_LprAFG lipoprotein [Mycobacterium vicinigordonae]